MKKIETIKEKRGLPKLIGPKTKSTNTTKLTPVSKLNETKKYKSSVGLFGNKGKINNNFLDTIPEEDTRAQSENEGEINFDTNDEKEGNFVSSEEVLNSKFAEAIELLGSKSSSANRILKNNIFDDEDKKNLLKIETEIKPLNFSCFKQYAANKKSEQESVVRLSFI